MRGKAKATGLGVVRKRAFPAFVVQQVHKKFGRNKRIEQIRKPL